MIEIYTAPSCTSCKKAKSWLAKHNIAFQERNIIADPLSAEEIKKVLTRSDDGVEGLISTRNRHVKALGVEFEDMSLSHAIDFIAKNPQVLRRPIIIDEKRMHVGYNEEEIRTFLPRTVRMIENASARMLTGI
ncbi:MAG: transcriptional regulator Spx [Lactovum sp.]